ncbi:Ig-like domain-containing protein [Streptomyces griseus]|uniref:Ig-like domain-containing protein n=1 Tax=Streptomyces griseus TaxID=1911 RepID=UPI000568A292|nr:Ig-like domain-containing protein [Streptomyces griseus]
MRRSRPSTAAALMCSAAALAASAPQASATVPDTSVHHRGDLWAAVTIVPGRAGVLDVSGHTGPAPGAGSTLTLTAPGRTTITDTPLAAQGYRGAIAADGRSGTYTFTGTGTQAPWQGLSFPFVVAVPGDAVPGTRLTGCTLRLTDAEGVTRDDGTCAVTVGLPEPTLVSPTSGVPLGLRPEVSGTAYPGAQVAVRDKDDTEVCSTTAGADGAWSCAPAPGLPAGDNRLQATATLNGVSAASEQVAITVAPPRR